MLSLFHPTARGINSLHMITMSGFSSDRHACHSCMSLACLCPSISQQAYSQAAAYGSTAGATAAQPAAQGYYQQGYYAQ